MFRGGHNFWRGHIFRGERILGGKCKLCGREPIRDNTPILIPSLIPQAGGGGKERRGGGGLVVALQIEPKPKHFRLFSMCVALFLCNFCSSLFRTKYNGD